MSHRLPPEDRNTLLWFCTLGVLFATWWIVLGVLT